MYVFITILTVIVCLLLGAIILIQNPKGGGLSSSFSGMGQQLLGARQSTDIVEKLTWGFAVALLAFCLTSGIFIDKNNNKVQQVQRSEIEEQEMKKGFQGNVPAATPAPTQTPTQPK